MSGLFSRRLRQPEYNYMDFSVPFRPVQYAIHLHFPYFYYTRLSNWVSLFRSLSFLVPVQIGPTLFRMLPSSLLIIRPCLFKLFSAIFFCQFYCTSYMFISGIIFIRVSQHPHPFHILSPFASFWCCSYICTVHQCLPFHLSWIGC